VLWRYAAIKTYSPTNNTFFRDFHAGRGGTYLDIGANIGLTFVPVAQDPHLRCIAFEADLENFANLRDNVRRNVSHDNIELHQIALFDRRTTVRFALDNTDNPGDHRIIVQDSDRRVIEVPAPPLDELITVADGPLSAKIDVQGAEPFVIAGGRATLDRIDALILEFSPYHMAQLNADVGIVLDYLAGFARLATVPGGSDTRSVFAPASDVLDGLRRFAKEAIASDEAHFDVHALRAQE
jgi:FkbM family methyltransferase